MCLIDQSGVTEGGLDPYNHYNNALFINIDNMWMERFGNLRLSCLIQHRPHTRSVAVMPYTVAPAGNSAYLDLSHRLGDDQMRLAACISTCVCPPYVITDTIFTHWFSGGYQ